METNGMDGVRGMPGAQGGEGGSRRWPWCALAVAALLAWPLVPAATAAADGTRDSASSVAQLYTTTDEYKLKAAYLFNFAKYVEWPASRLPAADSPIVIGVLGADPFGDRLDRTVKGRVIGRHPVVVRRGRRLEELSGCHMLFVCRSERAHEKQILEWLHETPVLTVSEGDDFVHDGGMIWLGRSGDAVEFDVNLDAVRAAGLTMGARMLGSARNVVNARDGKGR
jgi:hypothetical protein